MLNLNISLIVERSYSPLIEKIIKSLNILSNHPDAQSDLEKFKLGGVDLQVFSVWVSPNEFEESEYFQHADNMITKLEFLCSRVPDKWRLIKTYQDISYNQKRNIRAELGS